MFSNKYSTSAINTDPTISMTPVGVYAISIYANGTPLNQIEAGSAIVEIGGVSMDGLQVQGNVITFFNGVEGYDKIFHLEYRDVETGIEGQVRFDVYQMF